MLCWDIDMIDSWDLDLDSDSEDLTTSQSKGLII